MTRRNGRHPEEPGIDFMLCQSDVGIQLVTSEMLQHFRTWITTLCLRFARDDGFIRIGELVL